MESMNKKTPIGIALIAVLITAIATVQGEVTLPFLTEKGELFLLNQGETETIQIQGGRITVQLLEISHDPESISDVRIDDIIFSDTNPDVGENVHITVPVTNIGTGAAHDVGVHITYGDEHQNGSQGGEGIIAQINPGETVVLEYDHIYDEENIYTVMFVAKAGNDIDNGNNIMCKEIRVGDPEGPGSGGCGALSQQVIPKDAHILYKKYHGNNVIDQQELWLSADNIGYVVEVLKLSDEKALLAVPR